MGEVASREVSRGREDELLDAIRSGRIKRVHELLRQGLDPNTIDARGVSCLSLAILQRNCEMVRLLLIAGANPNARVVTQNQSPSMLLSMRVDDRKIAQLLINAGCNIQNLNMQMAARLGCCHGFKSFLERGLDVNNQDTTGRTMLHAAVTADKPNVVDLLIRWSANVNRDKFSQTPVCTAIVLNYVDCLDILLANGAQMRAINRRKDSALKVASKLMTRKMDTVDCVIRHLAILESQGPFVEPDDYELIEQLPLAVRDYLNICRNELVRAKKTMITPFLSFYDILTEGEKNRFVNDVEAINAVKMCDSVKASKGSAHLLLFPGGRSAIDHSWRAKVLRRLRLYTGGAKEQKEQMRKYAVFVEALSNFPVYNWLIRYGIHRFLINKRNTVKSPKG